MLGQPYRSTFVSYTLIVLASMVCGAPTAGQQDDEPSHVRRSLELAAVQLNAGNPRQAILALTEVETAEPENPWLWYYKGVANAQLGGAYPAMEFFDRAAELLARIDPADASLALLIHNQRQSVRREVFRLSLRIGSAYDTNVTFLGGDAVAEGLIAGEEDGAFGSEFAATFSPIKDDAHSLTFGLTATNLWQFRVDEFDVQDYTGLVRYSLNMTPRSTLSLQVKEEVIYLGNEPYLFSPAGTLGWEYRWPASGGSAAALHPTETTAFYRVESRDFRYRVESDFDRDGVSQIVGVAQGFRFRPIPTLEWYWDAHVGYQFEEVRTQGTEFDRRVHVAHAGVAMPLVHPKDTTRYLLVPDKPLWLAFRVDWEVARYRNESLNDRDDRQRVDRTGTYRLVLSQLLRRDADTGDVTLHAVLRWSDADSNLRTTSDTSPFTYDKFVFGLQIEWSW